MSAPDAKPQESTWQGLKNDFRWAGPVIFFAVIGLAGLLHAPWQAPTEGTENLTNVTDTIFATNDHSFEAQEQQRADLAAGGPARAAAAQRETTNVLVAFEILSALLLAALIAGVVIALRERGDD